MTKDKQRGEYAKVDQLKAGSWVVVDGDFTCLKPWSTVQVYQDAAGLYIPCHDGNHYLDGQLDDANKHYVGVYLSNLIFQKID